LCVSQQEEIKNTTKKRFEESPCRKLFAKKVEENKTLFLYVAVSPLDFFTFLVRFWAFLGKGNSKTPYKYFNNNLYKFHVENALLQKV
jgi:hypothetical protein